MDPELDRRLKHLHQTIELAAFLLAVLLILHSSFGVLVGGAAAALLTVNAANRWLTGRRPDSVAE